MLEKYIELQKRVAAKKQAKLEAVAAIEEEFGDVEAQLEAERAKIKEWMVGENMTVHMEANGYVEIRPSREKYIVQDDDKVIVWLYNNGHRDALTYKKSEVNTYRQLNQIPDDIVTIVREDELMIRTK